MKIDIEKKITIWFILALSISLFFTYLTFQSRVDYLERGRWVKRSYDIQAEIQNINDYMQQIEIASHHYMVTGSHSCLAMYNHALDSLNRSISDFTELTKNNPRQQKLINILCNLNREKLSRHQKFFTVRKNAGEYSAIKGLAESNNEELIDSLRTVINMMDYEEDRRLNEKLLAQQLASQKAFLSLVTLVIIFLLMVGIFYWLILNDIKKRKKAEHALKDLNASKDKFFSVLAHDLRSPFSGLIGVSEYMANCYDMIPKDEMKELLEVVNASAKKIFGLLNNLLEWSRLQMGKIEYTPSATNLYEIADEIVELQIPNSGSKDITIKNEIDSQLKVYADVNMISTVFRNLISNAVKFTNAGGQIILSAVKNELSAEIMISDTGIGMDADTMNKIFKIDSKITTKGTAGEDGTGLGLILCRELVEKNKGEIIVKSRINEGTQFIFTLPLVKEEVKSQTQIF